MIVNLAAGARGRRVRPSAQVYLICLFCSTRSFSETAITVVGEAVITYSEDDADSAAKRSLSRSVVHVAGRVDDSRQLADADLEAILDLFESRAVLISAHEGDRKALGAEATGATDAM